MFFRHLRTKKHAQRALREKRVLFWKNPVLRMVCLSLSTSAALSRTLVPAQPAPGFPWLPWPPATPVTSRELHVTSRGLPWPPTWLPWHPWPNPHLVSRGSHGFPWLPATPVASRELHATSRGLPWPPTWLPWHPWLPICVLICTDVY